MSAPTLDTRIATFQREMRRQIPWLLLVPATACFIMYRYTEYLHSPQATLDVWPIAGVLFGGAVVMSALLGRLVARASARANFDVPKLRSAIGWLYQADKDDEQMPEMRCVASRIGLTMLGTAQARADCALGSLIEPRRAAAQPTVRRPLG